MTVQPNEETRCPYCTGKGGRERYVYSRFLGTEPQVHAVGWETCWSCNGSGARPASSFPDGQKDGR